MLKYGTYLARRWDDARGINLYYCEDEGRGIFVEVGFNDERRQAVVLRSFVNSGTLEGYAQGVRLLWK